uniref:Uncharacterized protein n=1 Tax=Rousettus aegyptiacus TaxID=9407 RepID=A0A7J8JI36_ROUAE|nr:hypothetical protein HJG63_010360 [Rousettus aegyptiacus]
MSHLPWPTVLWCLPISLELEASTPLLTNLAWLPTAQDKVQQGLELRGEDPAAALRPRPWVPQGTGLTQPLQPLPGHLSPSLSLQPLSLRPLLWPEHPHSRGLGRSYLPSARASPGPHWASLQPPQVVASAWAPTP